MTWFESAQRCIAQAVAMVFGMDPASDEAADFIRFPYKEDSTTMQPGNNKNVCYVSLSAAPEITNKPYRNVVYKSNGKADIERAISMNCDITFYGPDSDMNAQLLRTGIMFDGGYGTPRFFMREHNIVPIGMPDSPSSMPEVIDGYWRYRADIIIRMVYFKTYEFNYNQVTNSDVSIGVKTK